MRETVKDIFPRSKVLPTSFFPGKIAFSLLSIVLVAITAITASHSFNEAKPARELARQNASAAVSTGLLGVDAPSQLPAKDLSQSSPDKQAVSQKVDMVPAQPADPTKIGAAVSLASFPNTYPAKWANVKCGSVKDTWGLPNCDSASYASWKVSEDFGSMPKWGDDASSWPGLADRADRQQIGRGATPKVHSVGVTTNMGKGVLAWVEAVEGKNVVVSSYNFNGDDKYQLFTVPASSFETYIYFGS